MQSDTELSILHAPEHQLRALLKLLLSGDDTKLHKKIEELYSVVVKLDRSSTSDKKDRKRKADFDDSAEKVMKRANLVKDIHICEQCEDTFLESENSDDACQYHPEEPEMDEEASIWGDWEDWRDGDMFAPSNKEEYPEGFVYPCCERSGEAKGCKVGRHVPRNADLAVGELHVGM